MMFVVAFFLLIMDSYGVLTPTKIAHLWVFPIVLVSLLLPHKVRTIGAMKTYSFQDVEFKRGSTTWEFAITDAQNSVDNLSAR
jgi:hypothetical protein